MNHFKSSYPVHVFSRMSPNPEEAFPLELWDVSRAPAELFVQGSPEALALFSKLPHRGLAVVGSRLCQNRSIGAVRSVLKSLAGLDLVILSGLARGIDSVAHQAALDEGFPTIAILGCGLNCSYPVENHELRRRILDSVGLIVSEFPMDAEPRADHFIRRNRLIAGWSRATWVVEAGYRSGAINTASWAKAQQRPCFVTPCFPGDSTLMGNQRLLENQNLLEGDIRPLWGPQSLATVWLEIEGHLTRRKAVRSRPVGSRRHSKNFPLKGRMIHEIKRRSVSHGGVLMAEFQQEWLKQGFAAHEFFSALKEVLADGLVIMQCGVLIDSSTQSLNTKIMS